MVSINLNSHCRSAVPDRLGRSRWAILCPRLIPDLKPPLWHQPATRKPVPADLAEKAGPRKKLNQCELLHTAPVRPALNFADGQERPLIRVRSARRPPHRLRPDRHRHRGHPVCVALSPVVLSTLQDGGSVLSARGIKYFPRALSFSPNSGFRCGGRCPAPARFSAAKAVKQNAPRVRDSHPVCVNRA
jgi:hypothetical protein